MTRKIKKPILYMKFPPPRFFNQFLSLVKCAMMFFVFLLANNPAWADLPAGWTDADIGSECPACGCTLGADGYWYVDAESAPCA